jgi:hypothetical protein
MPFRHAGGWQCGAACSEPRRWMEDIRQICWYPLNRRRLVDLRNLSEYCEGDKMLLINDVLFSEVAVDSPISKFRFPENERTSFLQYLWLPQRCCLWF